MTATSKRLVMGAGLVMLIRHHAPREVGNESKAPVLK